MKKIAKRTIVREGLIFAGFLLLALIVGFMAWAVAYSVGFFNYIGITFFIFLVIYSPYLVIRFIIWAAGVWQSKRKEESVLLSWVKNIAIGLAVLYILLLIIGLITSFVFLVIVSNKK